MSTEKTGTCLREAAPAKAGNAAGGFFQQTHLVIRERAVVYDDGQALMIAEQFLQRE